MKKNGHGVELIRPLPHRTDLIIVKLADGRRRTFGDGLPLSSDEFIKVQGGLTESTEARLKFTDDEKSGLAVASERLSRASTVVNRLHDEAKALQVQIEAIASARVFEDDPLNDADRAAIDKLQEQREKIRGQIIEAAEIEQTALVAYNETNARVHRAARARQFPTEYHAPARSMEQRLSDLEGQK